jgi:DNA methyltransferase 1-associated protein 1
VPAYPRSTRLPLPKPTAAIRITEILGELGVSTARLVMATRHNMELYAGVLTAANGLVDMKRQVDRVEQELRTLRAQREGFIAPIDSRKVSRRMYALAKQPVALRVRHIYRHLGDWWRIT